MPSDDTFFRLNDLLQSPAYLRATDLVRDPSTYGMLQHLQTSPAVTRVHELLHSPTLQQLQELHSSPTLRYLRELEESPSMRLARELQQSQPAWLEKLQTPPWYDIGHSTAGLGFTGAVARATQWSRSLHDADAGVFSSISSRLTTAIDEFARIQQVAQDAYSVAAGLSRLHSPDLSSLDLSAELSATRFKLSALAGAGDVLGFDTRAGLSAYHSLFGEWHTRPDLPPGFWRDPALRQRLYREAEVDPGLIEATPAEALEVVIDSGFAVGLSQDGIAVVELDIAGVSMQIRSHRAGIDAYRALTVFERRLRDFITAKLSASGGPKWFKQRVDQRLHAKAKGNRAAALANGEQETTLIAYLDLGELLQIMTRNDNWQPVFEPVFPNQSRLRSDFETLIALRRPTMHARRTEAVQLLEAMCIMARLTQNMEQDGQWRIIAESDE